MTSSNGGVVIGARFWVPNSGYFQVRYIVNLAILDSLSNAGVALLNAGSLAMMGEYLSADHEEMADS